MRGNSYLVKQHDITDCAAACLAMVCMYYKKEITITKLRDILGTDIKGTTLLGLENGAKRLGFDTRAIRVDKEGFKRQHMLLYLSQKIDIPLLLGYFKHVYKLPMKFFAARKVGDILTRFSDAFTIKNILTSVSLSLIMDIVLATVSACILYVMNQTLFIVILVLTIISAALIYIFKGPYKKINLDQMEAGARLNSQIIEGLKGIETVKVHAAEDNSIEKLEIEYIRNLRIAFKEGVLSNIQESVSGMISTIGNLFLMYIGATMIMKGDITLGTLMSFSTLSGYFMDPIGRLISLQLSIQEASISLKRISEIYEVEKEQDEDDNDKIKIEKIDGDIELKNITFRYGSRSPVLKNVSIKIPKGKKVALVGVSGSGKTTISKLLLKYYEPEEGQINISGYNIDELDLYSLREKICYVPQNVELFSGSIKENITLGKTNASYEEIKAACENAGCREFIEKLPGKYGTFLEEAGGGLSGGEKQRIALARALVKKPSFLILDEATSNLDFISEAKIFDTLFKKGRNITMLMIAHRLSTIRSCDIIYVMDKGQVVEVGNHESLLSKKGYYYKLYISQVGSLKERDGLFNDEVACGIEEKKAIFDEMLID